jgi:hypothetical protein
MEEAVSKHPHPELFAARLQDLRDGGFDSQAFSLEYADKHGVLRGTCERSLALKVHTHPMPLTVLRDILDDLDDDAAAADAAKDLVP